MIRDEYHQEAVTHQAMIQSEGDVARLYKGRYEHMAQSALGKDPSTDQIIKSLKSRLDHEANHTNVYREKHAKASEELSETMRKLKGNQGFNDRLRDDRNEHRAYSQELYEQLWENEEYGAHEVGEETHAETAEPSKGEGESKSSSHRDHAIWAKVAPQMANIRSARADPDQEAWISWIGESFKLNPDIIKMSDSCGLRFTTIDVNLANALNALIASSGDSGKEAAAPKAKAKAATAKAKSAAVVVEVNRENNTGYLSDWSDAEDSSPVAAGRALVDPHVTEVVVPVEPFEFPFKAEYEKINGRIEGLRDRDDPEIEDQGGDEDEDGNDDDDDRGDKPKEPKISDKEKPELLHYSEGAASDGIIYVNDVGDEVKLDPKGRAYRVGNDGRKLMPTKRPPRYISPEEWKKMSPREREASTKAADDIAREEVEEEDRAAKKKSKKEKKDKKDKKKKKSDKEAEKEMEDMFEALAESAAEARASGSKDKAAPSPSLTDDDVSTDGDASSYDSEEYHDEWLEWEEFVSQQEGPGVKESQSSEHVYEALVCITEDVKVAEDPKKEIQRFFVELPPEAWPSWVKLQDYRRPVVRLRKALYGHPDLGNMWEQHCDKAVKEVGFVAVGPEWPSTYYHKETKLLLVVYVDDLKMAGPESSTKQGWAMLRSKLDLEPETDLGLYLACQLVRGETKLKDGTKVSTITYDMESFLEQSVQKYLGIVGKDTILKKAPTPSLPEEAKDHPARAPCGAGPVSQCTWCGTIHPITEPTASKTDPTGSSAPKPGDEMKVGELAPHAARVLMKLLYCTQSG
eukprot:symbB.v1.2.029410.t1/scaffold3211.1/size107887/2